MSKKEPSIHDLRGLPDLAREYGYRTPATLAQAAKDSRLKAIKPGHDWLSCPQWIEEFQRALAHGASLGAAGRPVEAVKRAKGRVDDGYRQYRENYHGRRDGTLPGEGNRDGPRHGPATATNEDV